jgi:hypothetical protein
VYVCMHTSAKEFCDIAIMKFWVATNCKALHCMNLRNVVGHEQMSSPLFMNHVYSAMKPISCDLL